MFKRMKEQDLEKIMEEGKKYVVVDYLGIKNNKSKSMKQEENVDN